ncbi:MAG: pyridoxamine 5'-phosphate oxidase family protein [Actinomycetota bacterium]|nr:pyridoxamine 5'-phosphate oxidase family protein [Actinomycetota bacterium]
MRETREDFERLQSLLDESYARAGEHLRSIFRPELRFSAEDLAAFFVGRRQVAVATVSEHGDPRVAPVDALLLEGAFHFGTHVSAARVRHLRANPAVSLTYYERDELAVVVHGTAELMEFRNAPFEEVDEAFVHVYGGTLSTAEEASVYVRVEPTAMFTYARDPSLLRHADA